MGEFLQFLLLIAGLIVLGVSTRQFPLMVRVLCWLGGCLLFVLAAGLALTADPNRVGLFTILGDAFKPSPTGKSVIGQALSGDWLGGAMAPLFDIFIVFGAVMAILAAIALTPGDALDRAVRPLIAGIIGALVGGFIALALVASGLSGTPRDRTYIARGADVIDGDTIRMGDVSMRLAGIDAPEYYDGDATRWSQHNQACRFGGALFACGLEARDYLTTLVRGAIVICRPLAQPPAGELREAYGRPIVQCEVRPKQGDAFDLAAKMAADGYADVFRDNGAPPVSCDAMARAVAAAQTAKKGMWRGTMLTPYAWRYDDDARALFMREPARNAREPVRRLPDISVRC